MNVDLGGVEIGMAQPFLQLEGRDALFSLGCGESMPKRMGTGVLRYPCLVFVLPHELADPSLTQGLTLVIEEEVVLKGLEPDDKVVLDGL
jgi:hypothetical protein